MSNPKSNLSAYHYDLVVATTTKAINANIKRWLHHQSNKKHSLKLFFKQVEYPDDSVSVEVMTPEEYIQIAQKSGVDVLDENTFKPGNYSSKDNDDLKKFNENNELITYIDGQEVYHSFQSVVYFEMGLPKSRNRNFNQFIPDLIELNANEIQFTLTFNNYKVVEFSAGRHKASLSVKAGTNPKIKEYIQEASILQSQPVNANTQKLIRQQWVDKIGPYFRYTVDLSTKSTTFEELPKSVQDKIKSMHGDNMFGLDQLYLDLTTTKLLHFTELGLSPKIKQLLANAAEEYFKVLDQKNEEGDNAFIFGYFIKNNEKKQRSTLRPTDLDFIVSPCIENDKEVSPLNTLNYLVMTHERHFPARKQAFNWNWVDTKDENTHGAIAIRREVFADYLKSLLIDDGRLNHLLLEPVIHYSAEYTVADFYSFWLKKLEPTTNFKYDLTETNTSAGFIYHDQGEEILNIFWHKRVSDRASAGGKYMGMDFTCAGDALGDYYFESRIKFQGNNIIFFADIRCAYDIQTPRNHIHFTEEELVHWRLEKTYNLIVNEKGAIVVHKTGEPQEIKSQRLPSQEMMDAFNKTLKFVATDSNDIETRIHTAFIDYTSHIDKYINDALTKWVFPGANTFHFRDIKFSEHQDLVATIAYKLNQ